MRNFITVLVVLTMAAVVMAADEKCPSAQVTKAGVSEFDGFHNVIAPVWHGAYPDSNLDAMMAAGPDFEKALIPIAGIEAKMKNVSRKAAFLMNREKLANYVKRYAAACKAGYKDSLYALLPDLHEAFEKTASACLPTPYPEFDGLVVTVNLILNTHLPKNNTKGIIGSTETLVAKAKNLTVSSLPTSLRNKENVFLPEFQAIQALAGQIQECCARKDMAKYKPLAEELKGKLAAFESEYL